MHNFSECAYICTFEKIAILGGRGQGIPWLIESPLVVLFYV